MNAKASSPSGTPIAPAVMLERPLYGALAGAPRQRQGRNRPRLTVGEEREHRRMLLIDGPRQHDNFAPAAPRERNPALAALTAASLSNTLRSHPTSTRNASNASTPPIGEACSALKNE